jgi:hypothetical protein
MMEVDKINLGDGLFLGGRYLKRNERVIRKDALDDTKIVM